MQSVIFYFIQVVICSAILYSYYLLVLRNKRFHQYNRFYLLSILLISWLMPLIRITLPTNSSKIISNNSYRLFDVIADSSTHLEDYVVGVEYRSQSWSDIAFLVYLVVAGLLIIHLIVSVCRIFFLIRRSERRPLGNAILVLNKASKGPFSFFQFIFWNDQLDLDTTSGKQVLNHELTHVQEKHSYDILLASIVTAAGWLNPVFWLVKRELKMVHEFIADKKAVNSNPTDFARMLLAASFPTNSFVTHSFFHSPIKRRLFMINSISLAKYPYLRRLLVLPLLAVVVGLLAFRKEIKAAIQIRTTEISQNAGAEIPVVATTLDERESRKPAQYIPLDLQDTYTIMIDAGHGGKDAGAMAEDGTKESDIALELANTVRDVNTNQKLKLVFTRNDDAFHNPLARLDMITQSNADLLVSLHVSTATIKSASGVEIYIPNADTLSHYKASYQLANFVGNAVSGSNVSPASKVQIRTRKFGIYVIDKAARPAILVEAGFLSNSSDLKKLKTKEYKEKLAKAILSGVEQYLKSKE